MSFNPLHNSQVVGQNESHLIWLSPNLALNKNIIGPWKDMVHHAQQSGIELAIASGYRSFERQLTIWNKKFTGELAVRNKNNDIIDLQHLSDVDKVMAILTYSALPGASRHHWGTDIDVYATNLLPQNKSLQLEPWEYQEHGYFFKLSEWLTNNAHTFGFFFPYLHDQGGVAIEPWHLSFQSLSQQYQQQLTLPVLEQVITVSEIAGKQAILANLATIFAQYITNICNVSDIKNISTASNINKDHHG